MISTAVVQSFRRAAIPLAWYYAVTLALPLANGAAHAGAAFVEHALVVLVFPLVLVVIVDLIRGVVFGHRRSEYRSSRALRPLRSIVTFSGAGRDDQRRTRGTRRAPRCVLRVLRFLR